ncbi:MAG: hypothetical protein WCF60_10855 [Anaerobacillus sp.]
MSKQEAKGVAAGLLFAAILLTAYYFMFAQATAEEGNQPSEAEIEQHLKENGMVMVTKDEYAALKAEQPTGVDDKQKSTNQESTDQEDKQKKDADAARSKKVSFSIKEGMTSLEVAQSLEDQKLVNKSDDFIDTLRDMGKEMAVQPGDYELQTDMSSGDIVKEITR